MVPVGAGHDIVEYRSGNDRETVCVTVEPRGYFHETRIGVYGKFPCNRAFPVAYHESFAGKDSLGAERSVADALLGRPVVPDDDPVSGVRRAGASSEGSVNLVAVHPLSVVVMVVVFLEPFVYYEPAGGFDPYVGAQCARELQCRPVDAPGDEVVFVCVVVGPFRYVPAVCEGVIMLAFSCSYGVDCSRSRRYVGLENELLHPAAFGVDLDRYLAPLAVEHHGIVCRKFRAHAGKFGKLYFHRLGFP